MRPRVVALAHVQWMRNSLLDENGLGTGNPPGSNLPDLRRAGGNLCSVNDGRLSIARFDTLCMVASHMLRVGGDPDGALGGIHRTYNKRLQL